tara:strand:- start:141 stop:479 length:339 start_codon:yes stop_codon:yes gene_type:complete
MKVALGILASFVVAVLLAMASADAMTVTGSSGERCVSVSFETMSNCDACTTGDVEDSLGCTFDCTMSAQGVIGSVCLLSWAGPMQHRSAQFDWLAGIEKTPEPYPPRPNFLS